MVTVASREQPESNEETILADAPGRARPSPRPRSQREFQRGDEVGRYVILERVGAGGMGVVYAAWDPKLDRKVALKLLHDDPVNQRERGQRLEREAQAMARLTHPNVIAVHDVGEVAGRVFMALEFVEGETLGRWARLDDPSKEGRPWSEVLEVALAAGRGLAAAHAEGLVHRDFKPDNVMIGADGRVRVMDFGLVRAAAPAPVDPGAAADVDGPARSRTGPRATVLGITDLLDETHASAALDSPLDSQLTRVGALLGTPAYMAPEQLHGDEADTRSDQFSFCVAVWQCLYGVRPFAGDSPLAILFAISEGRFAEPPPGRAVPTWLRRVLERGLAAEPSERWSDMWALLDALTLDPVQRRRPWLLGGASLIVAVVAAAAAIVLEGPPPVGPCVQAGEELRELWSDPARARLAERFAASELIYAGETWTRVEAGLDRWAGDWVEARRSACEDSEIRHQQSAELLDLRMACLDHRRDRFAALVELFASADDTVVERAVEAVEALPPLEPCADRSWLMASVRPPEDPELAGRVAAVREQLAKVTAMSDAGKAGDAVELAERLDATATELGWAPTIAEAAGARGRVAQELGSFADAAPTLERAYFAARRSGHDEITILAGVRLIYTLSVGLGEFDRSSAWIDHVLAEAERIGRDDLVAEVYSSIGIHHTMRGEIDAATAAFGRALELHEDADSSSIAAAHINYGTILVRSDPGRRDEAFAELDRGIAMLEASLGPQHPNFAVALSNYATVHGHLGERREAIALLDRALEIQARALGEDHPMTGLLELNLAKNLVELDDPDSLARASTMAERSLATHQKVYGERHIMVAESQRAVAVAQLRRGHPREAMTSAQAAVDVWAASFGAAHAETNSAELVLARCEVALARRSEARVRLERILGYELEDAKVRSSAQLELADLLVDEDPERAANLLSLAKPYFEAMGDDRNNQRIIALERELAARG